MIDIISNYYFAFHFNIIELIVFLYMYIYPNGLFDKKKKKLIELCFEFHISYIAER